MERLDEMDESLMSGTYELFLDLSATRPQGLRASAVSNQSQSQISSVIGTLVQSSRIK